MIIKEEKRHIQISIPPHIQAALQDIGRSYEQIRKPLIEAAGSLNQSGVLKQIAYANLAIRESGINNMLIQAQKSVDRWKEQSRQFTTPLSSNFMRSDQKVLVTRPLRRTLSVDDAHWMIDEISERINNIRQPKIVRIFVDKKNKKIFKEANDKAVYSYRSGARVTILLELKHDFLQTKKLAEVTGYDRKTLRTTIQKINSALSKKLGIDFRLIEGNPGDGYKLSSRCLIALMEGVGSCDA